MESNADSTSSSEVHALFPCPTCAQHMRAKHTKKQYNTHCNSTPLGMQSTAEIHRTARCCPLGRAPFLASGCHVLLPAAAQTCHIYKISRKKMLESQTAANNKHFRSTRFIISALAIYCDKYWILCLSLTMHTHIPCSSLAAVILPSLWLFVLPPPRFLAAYFL